MMGVQQQRGETGEPGERELRHLLPTDRRQLCDILEHGEGWKRVMGVVPKSRQDRTNKYSADQVATLEGHASPSRPGMELLLHEWATSGCVRPTLNDLYLLCKEVEEERAAAFLLGLMGGKEPAHREYAPIGASCCRKTMENGSGDADVEKRKKSSSANNKARDVWAKGGSSGGSCSSAVTAIIGSSSTQTGHCGHQPETSGEPSTFPGIGQFPLPNPVPATDELNQQLDDLGSLEEHGEDLSLVQSPLPHFGFSFLERITNHWCALPHSDGGNKLGAGAFGAVFYGQLAGQLGMENCAVAVKRLSRDTPDIERLFNTEVEMMGLVTHEHLLSLLAYSSDGADLCLLYPYMEGGSLQDRLACRLPNKPALPPMQRLRVAKGSAEGLQFLHQGCSSHTKPLVHRDVKSANILLDRQGEPKICDFGLVRLGEFRDGRGATVRTEMVVGTTVYMSPDAMRGEVGPKMDVYSLGVVILELLTGLPPVMDAEEEGEGVTNIVAHMEEVDKEEVEEMLDRRFSLMEWRQVFPKDFYVVAEECMKTKKKRPDMTAVVQMLEALFH